jgi:hypothetical protein
MMALICESDQMRTRKLQTDSNEQKRPYLASQILVGGDNRQ